MSADANHYDLQNVECYPPLDAKSYQDHQRSQSEQLQI